MDFLIPTIGLSVSVAVETMGVYIITLHGLD